jgi:hypothetical protein
MNASIRFLLPLIAYEVSNQVIPTLPPNLNITRLQPKQPLGKYDDKHCHLQIS